MKFVSSIKIKCFVVLDVRVNGAFLVIENVSRHCDDIYECEAFNGVPPSVVRQIRVTVECNISNF